MKHIALSAVDNDKLFRGNEAATSADGCFALVIKQPKSRDECQESHNIRVLRNTLCALAIDDPLFCTFTDATTLLLPLHVQP